MNEEIQAGAPQRRRVLCPTHHVTSTFTPAEEVIDDMTFHFLQVDACNCLYAFAITSPRIDELKADVSKLWQRAHLLHAAGDLSGVSRTQSKITAAELRVKDVQRNLWAEHSHRLEGEIVGAAEGLKRAAQD